MSWVGIEPAAFGMFKGSKSFPVYLTVIIGDSLWGGLLIVSCVVLETP